MSLFRTLANVVQLWNEWIICAIATAFRVGKVRRNDSGLNEFVFLVAVFICSLQTAHVLRIERRSTKNAFVRRELRR